MTSLQRQMELEKRISHLDWALCRASNSLSNRAESQGTKYQPGWMTDEDEEYERRREDAGYDDAIVPVRTYPMLNAVEVRREHEEMRQLIAQLMQYVTSSWHELPFEARTAEPADMLPEVRIHVQNPVSAMIRSTPITEPPAPTNYWANLAIEGDDSP